MHIDDWRRQPCIKPNVDHAVVVSINAFQENTISQWVEMFISWKVKWEVFNQENYRISKISDKISRSKTCNVVVCRC